MLEKRKIKIEDNNSTKEFSIKKLGAIPTLKLAMEIGRLLADTDLIKSIVLQQFMVRMLETNDVTEMNEEERAQFERMAQMDVPNIITYFVKSVLFGLDDNKIDTLLEKCFGNVTYHNGSYEMQMADALKQEMIEDFTVIVQLVYEVMAINFTGAFDRLKKLLTQFSKTQK